MEHPLRESAASLDCVLEALQTGPIRYIEYQSVVRATTLVLKQDSGLKWQVLVEEMTFLIFVWAEKPRHRSAIYLLLGKPSNVRLVEIHWCSQLCD